MVVSEREDTPTPAELVWHDLECGGYRADLPLWQNLATRCDGPILDVGAGSGRVTVQLARAGHTVTALDRNELLLAALRKRTAGLDVEAVCGDARSFALARRDFALCIVPMQTIQLLGGADGRIAFLRAAREHVRQDAAIALAILGELDTFHCSSGAIGPAAERVAVDGLLYLSRAIRVSETDEHVEIERERRIVPAPGAADRSIDLIRLDRVDVATLRDEATEAGLRAEPALEIAATNEHVASSVVMLRA